jgi:hypothetical protein
MLAPTAGPMAAAGAELALDTWAGATAWSDKEETVGIGGALKGAVERPVAAGTVRRCWD